MKKKVFLRIAVACVLLGGALFSIGWVMGGKGFVFDFSDKEKLQIIGTPKEYSFTDMDYEAFKSVLLDVPDCSIYVGRSENEKFGIDMRLYTYDYNDIDIEIAHGDDGQVGDLLIRNSSETPGIYFNFDLFGDNEQYIKLYLPEGDYDYIHAGTDNNDIVFENVSAKTQVQADCQNGSITFINVSADKVAAYTSNDNASIDGADAKTLIIETTNGKAELKNTTADNVSVSTSNGKVELEDVRGIEAVLETTNGDIVLENVGFESSLDAQTTNDNIKATFCGDKYDYSYDIKTSNDIVTFDGDKCGDRYEGGSGQAKIKLRTTNGKISVKFD